MKNLLNTEWWKATAVRCLRTFLTTLLGFWTAGTLITEVNWRLAVLTAFSSTVYILLLCIVAGLPEVEGGNYDDTADY